MNTEQPFNMRAADYPAPGHCEPDLVLIGCGKEKAKSTIALKARNLYTGPLFTARRQFAESQARPWMILSALHGVVEPERQLMPYDATIDELKGPDLEQWKAAVRAKLMDYFGGSREGTIGKTIELHAGSGYPKQLQQAVQGLGLDIVCPMANLGIGVQISIYRKGYHRPHTIAGFGTVGMPKPPLIPAPEPLSISSPSSEAVKMDKPQRTTRAARPVDLWSSL